MQGHASRWGARVWTSSCALAAARIVVLSATVTACAGPASDPAPAACAAGMVADGDACVPDACGAGPWGAVEADAATLWVAPGGSGDGSVDAPLGSVQAALDLAGARGGGRVVLAAGCYDAGLTFTDRHDGVELVGRCREMVTLDGATVADAHAILVEGSSRRRPSVALRDLTITGGNVAALRAGLARLTVVGVDFLDTGTGAIAVGEAVADLRDVRVSGNRPQRRADTGWAVEAAYGARMSLSDVVIEDNEGYGLFVSGRNAEVDVRRVTIRGTRGRSVEVQGGALLSGADLIIEDGSDVGILVGQPGSAVVLENLGVYRCGLGVEALLGAVVELDGAHVSDVAAASVFAEGEGVAVTVRDSVLERSVPIEGDAGGTVAMGLHVAGGATVLAERTMVRDHHRVAVSVLGEGSRVMLRESTVVGTAQGSDGDGHGIEVSVGAVLDADGLVCRGNATRCMVVAGGRARVTGGIVADNGDAGDGEHVGLNAHGILVKGGGAVSLASTVVEGNRGHGLYAWGADTVLELADSTVTRTRPYPDGGFGRGIGVSDGATASIVGTRIEDNTEFGLFVGGAGASATLERSSVVGTVRNRTTVLAVGLVAQQGGRVTVRDSDVRDNDGPGIYVPLSGELDLEGGDVRGNRFAGIVVMDALARLRDVRLLDNGADPAWGGGVGVYGTGRFGPGSIDATGIVVGPHAYAAVWVEGAGAWSFAEADLAGSGGIPTVSGAILHGNAVFARDGVPAWDGRTGLRVRDSRLHGAAEYAVLLDGASASLTGVTWEDNGVDVRQQRCTGVEPVAEPDPGWEVCPPDAVLTDTSVGFDTLSVAEERLD